MVKLLLACGTRGPGFDSSRRYDFRDCSSPASKSQYGWNTAKLKIKTTNQPVYTLLVLFSAVRAESLDCVRCLLRRGAEINQQVYTGYTPLHMAAEKGYGSIVAYLIGHGARLETGADFDLTPIFLASQFGHSGCLKFMLKVAKEKGWSDRCVHKIFFCWIQF